MKIWASQVFAVCGR